MVGRARFKQALGIILHERDARKPAALESDLGQRHLVRHQLTGCHAATDGLRGLGQPQRGIAV